MNRMATHIIMHCISDSTVSDKLMDTEDDELTNDEGLQNVLNKLDEHFLTNHESKVFNTWTILRKTEKTSDMSWETYIKTVSQIVKGLERCGIHFGQKFTSAHRIRGEKSQ